MKKLTIRAVAVLALIVMLGLTTVVVWKTGDVAMGQVTRTIAATVSFRDHVANGMAMDWGTQDVSGEATASVQTKVAYVENCQLTIYSEAATTAAHLAICEIPTQTGTDRGKIIVNVNNVGSTASGTTSLYYRVTGYGNRY